MHKNKKTKTENNVRSCPGPQQSTLQDKKKENSHAQQLTKCIELDASVPNL